MRAGAEDTTQIGVIGFVVRVSRLPIVLGGERMDQPGVEAGLAESPFDGAMIFASAFNGDDLVSNVVLLQSSSNAKDASLQVGVSVRYGSGFKENVAIEISQEVPGAGFGTVETEDGEMLRTHCLDTLSQLTIGLVQDEARGLRRTGL